MSVCTDSNWSARVPLTTNIVTDTRQRKQLGSSKIAILLGVFKVIPLSCIAHPYCARFLAPLARAHEQNGGFLLCNLVRERNKSSISRKRARGPINFFTCSDQTLSIKWIQINFYVWKKDHHWKRVLCQYSQWNYKELCGKYKVFPLLNECGDPPLLQNLSSLEVINQWPKFGWKSMFSSISGEWP